MILFILKDILSRDVLFFLKVKLHFKGIFCSHRNVKRVFKKGGGETTFTLGNFNLHYFTFCKQTLFYCRILASNHFFTSFILYVKKNFVLILNGYSLNVHILIPSFIFSTISLFKSYPFM